MWCLLIALIVPSHAEDDEEFGFGDLDIDIGDIDLGDEGGPGSMSYTGGHTERSEALTPNAAVTVTHYGGPIRVRCIDQDHVSARVDFVLEGTSEPNLQAVGNGIRLQASGSEGWAKVSSIVPALRSGVTSMDVPMTVSAPKEVRLTVSGRAGEISVSGCRGTVKASTSKGSANVTGTFSQFDVRSGEGDVYVSLEEGSELTKTSGVTASRGKVELVMPLGVDVKLQATGAEVTVHHTVDGSNNPTNVSGVIGSGGPLVKVYGKEGVSITSP
jgi:hypothetical protein